MKVIVEKDGHAIWLRDSETLEGMISTEFLKDGTQQKIIAALEDALSQVQSQTNLANDID